MMFFSITTFIGIKNLAKGLGSKRNQYVGLFISRMILITQLVIKKAKKTITKVEKSC